MGSQFELKKSLVLVSAIVAEAYREGFNQGKLEQKTTIKSCDLGTILINAPVVLFTILGNDNVEDNKEHEVCLSPYYIGKYPITRKEWFDMYPEKDDGYGKLLRPITNISWYDAIRYCNARSLKEGLEPYYLRSGTEYTCNHKANGYRLPSEDEWEYAARGGAKGLEDNFLYAGSNDPDEVAWYDDNSKGRTHRVGKKKPNQLGLYDMSGNVWEWCWDQIAQNDFVRVLRGGSYGFGSGYLRSAFRLINDPGVRSYSYGFRVVRNVDTY